MPNKIGDIQSDLPKDFSKDFENDSESTENVGLLTSLKRYPKGVFFMLGNEFCERFSFYGMRAILTLYLIEEHHLTNR